MRLVKTKKEWHVAIGLLSNTCNKYIVDIIIKNEQQMLYETDQRLNLHCIRSQKPACDLCLVSEQRYQYQLEMNGAFKVTNMLADVIALLMTHAQESSQVLLATLHRHS